MNYLVIPKRYKGYWFLDLWIDPEPVGLDPETNQPVYLFDKTELSCDIDVTKLGYRPFRYAGSATFPSDF